MPPTSRPPPRAGLHATPFGAMLPALSCVAVTDSGGNRMPDAVLTLYNEQSARIPTVAHTTVMDNARREVRTASPTRTRSRNENRADH